MHLPGKKWFIFLTLMSCHCLFYSQIKNNKKAKIRTDKSYTARTYKINPLEKPNSSLYRLKGNIQGEPDFTFLYRDSLTKSNFTYLVRIWTKRKKTKGKSAENFYAAALKTKALIEYKEINPIQFKITKNENEFVLVKRNNKTFNVAEMDSLETSEFTYVIINRKYNNELILLHVTEVGDKIDIDKTINYFNEFIKEIKPIKPYYNKKWDATFLLAYTLLYDERESGYGYSYYDGERRGYTQKIQMEFDGTGTSFGRHIFENFWINARYIGYSKASNTNGEYFSRDDTTGIPALYNSVFERSPINTIGLNAEKRIFVSKKTSVDLDFGVIYASKFDFTFIERTSPGGPATEHKVYYNPIAGFEWGAKYRILFANHNCGVFLGLHSISLKYKYHRYTIDGIDSDLKTGKYFIPKIDKLNFSGLQFLIGTTYQF